MFLFLDLEVSTKTGKIKHIGGLVGCREDIKKINQEDFKVEEFLYKNKQEFINKVLSKLPENTYIFGHNILNFDQNFLPEIYKFKIIDTLYLSALFFPKKPYHKLIKSYKENKIGPEIENDPVKDSKLTFNLVKDIVSKIKTYDKNWARFLLSSENKIIKNFNEAIGFIDDFKGLKLYYGNLSEIGAKNILKEKLLNKVCENVVGYQDNSDNYQDDIKKIDKKNVIFEYDKIEFMIACNFLYEADRNSIPPKFLNFNEKFYQILDELVSFRCGKCDFCAKHNAESYLQKYFGYKSFRKFDGKNLQKEAVEKALQKEDLLVVFPTGGGKSLTFQLPALIKAEQTRKMTIVISPLLSLMKDQVENLRKKGISNVAYFNSLQNSLEIAQTHKAVQEGSVDILYLSPEKLQNQTVKKTLSFRKIDRFVIDEAHCFSKWGHDFRVDYLFIADFIKSLEKDDIKITCLTATAKKQVIEDIQGYFAQKLGKKLTEIKSSPNRNNLSFQKIECKNENEKLDYLIDLIDDTESSIVFTNTTTKAKELSEKLENEGFKVGFYHGKLDTEEKIKIQDEFINGKINTIIATNAFGMGVDKDNVRKVIHWEIPSSVENYLQEAGRAGRDGQESTCYVLYHQDDVEKIFQIQKMSEITENQFRSLFNYLKNIGKYGNHFKRAYSTLAVKMGIDLEKDENWQTKVKVALAVLEEKIELIKRYGQYGAKLFAGKGKKSQNLDQTLEEIESLNTKFDKNLLKEIYTKIVSNYGIELNYLVETLELDEKDFNKKKQQVLQAINILIEHNFLSSDTEYKVLVESKYFSLPTKTLKFIENIVAFLKENNHKTFSYKQIVDYFFSNNFLKNTNQQTVLLNFLNIYLARDRKYIKFDVSEVKIDLKETYINFLEKKLLFYAYKILEFLKGKTQDNKLYVEFLDTDIVNYFKQNKIAIEDKNIKIVQEILYFLHIHHIVDVKDGLRGFEQIIQLSVIAPNKKYEKGFYKILKQHYESKYQQAHIIDERLKNWENKKIYKNSLAIKQLVEDYFNLGQDEFIEKYFPNKKRIFKRPISEQKYNVLIKSLDKEQRQVITKNGNLLIIAGPGAGKTKTLVHKIASLILQEGVKEEEFLMLTFSNSAKYEIKKRLLDILGTSAYGLDVHTFHSFCYKILQVSAKTIDVDEVIPQAIQQLNLMENKLQKQVIVIDEYQDVNDKQFELIQTIINNCVGNVKIIACGDDDQNIYAFQGANLKYINEFEEKFNAKTIYLEKNYRSKPEIVEFSQKWIKQLKDRKKQDLKLYSVYEKSLFEELANIEILEMDENQINTLPLLTNLQKNTAYLTFLNQRAEMMSSYLKSKKIDHKLITNKEKFKFYHLLEVWDFLNYLKQEPFEIYDKIFNSIMKKLSVKYPNSPYLEYIEKMYNDFCSLNTRLYKDKLEEFVYDWEFPQKDIFVGTLHKSKGLEFDTVIIDLYGIEKLNEELIRLLYVGFTRAKNELKIVGNAKNPVFQKVMEILDKKAEKIKTVKLSEYETYFGLEDVYLGDNKLGYEENFSKVNLMQNYAIIDNKIYHFHKKLQSLSKKGIENLNKIGPKNIKKVDIYAKCVYKDEYLVYLPKFEINLGKI